MIERGLHLGYRKLTRGGGTWVARHYAGNQKYQVESLGIADDLSDADGNVLTYWQAQYEARKRLAARTKSGEGTSTAPATVRAVVESYIAERDERESKRRGRAVRSDAGQRLQRYVLGQKQRGKQAPTPPAAIAEKMLHELAESDLLKWRKRLPGSLKATSRQRLVNDLRAALNGGYREYRNSLPGIFPTVVKLGLKSEDAGDDAEPMARDNQILPDEQVSEILRAARDVDVAEGWTGDLFRLVFVLAATGARFSQVVRMRVADCQHTPVLNRSGVRIAAGRLLVPLSRKGRNRTAGSVAVPVGEDVLKALLPVTIGRAGNATLLERWQKTQVPDARGRITWQRGGRGPWGAASELTRPWALIREKAGMPKVIPYALRHSSIVKGIRENLPLRLVAALHDTSVAMIERHYARWITSGLEELAARAVVPLLPQEPAIAVTETSDIHPNSREKIVPTSRGPA
jgi:integrase